MRADELRKKFLDFFQEKGHAIIPSASLIPENDPTTLFTGSGMQPMIPYLLGEKHPLGTKIADSQKCFRAQDMEEVGDNRHTTFFEMLGNWSLGDYFKQEQIEWMFEFLTEKLALDPSKIYITVFRGSETLSISRDTKTVEVWKNEFSKVGIDAKDVDFSEENEMQNGRIFYYDETKNWWSRSGAPSDMPQGEPGGPDSEMFWDFGAELKIHENSKYKKAPCHVHCDCGRFMEIGNNVFMQYVKTDRGFELLPKGNIDFGGGLERMTAASNNEPDVFKTDLFIPAIKKIEEISKKTYGEKTAYAMQVIVDHIKATTFILAENLEPSNIERGYVLRRLIRRAIRYGKQLGIKDVFTSKIANVVIDIYRDAYPELHNNWAFIDEQLIKEEEKFGKTLERGLNIFQSQIAKLKSQNCDSNLKTITGEIAFDLYQTYGFPIELTEELAKDEGFVVDQDGFNKALKEHQGLSRAGVEQKFKGGLVDQSEQTIKYHTATHLLLAALRQVLGDHVFQKGSNITAERLRFDFSHPEKMTSEQIKNVENLINQKIKENLSVAMKEMSLEEAKEKNAMGVFEHRYGDRVKVYSIGDEPEIFSREICGGPHIESIGILGAFKIIKEEASAGGVRRIKAMLE